MLYLSGSAGNAGNAETPGAWERNVPPGLHSFVQQERMAITMTIKKKRSVKKLILIILLCVIILLTAGWGLFCVSIYNENFNVRGDSYEPLMLRLEDFSGLE